MKKWLLLLVLGLVMACQPQDEAPPIPTIYQIETWTATPSQTMTALPTPSPLPSSTFSPTPTSTDVPTLAPSQTPLPTSVRGVVNSEIGGFLRRGPGTEYEVVGELAFGEGFDVRAYLVSSTGNTWYLVQLADGSSAWVSDVVANLEGEAQLGDIAIAITQPPTTTITPTLTPTITPTLPQGANARVSGEKGVNLRSGAGYGYDILQVAELAAPLVLIGRNQTNTWYQAVTFESPEVGWVHRDFVQALIDTRLLAITWVGPALITGVNCGMNIQPRDGVGWNPIPNDLRRARWVRFPFTASPRHFPNLEAAFAYFDPIVSAYNAAGVKIIAVLTHETYGELGGWDWVGMTSADWNRFIPNYVSVVERIARHYGNRIEAYEVWNEGDAEKGNEAAVSISASDYAPMLRDAAAAIRRGSPQARILVGGLLDPSGTYLRQVKAALGGRLPVDAIAIHPYGRGAPTDRTVFSRLGDLSEVIDAYIAVAPEIPIWITEIGALGDNSQGRWSEATLYLENLFEFLRSDYYDVVEVVVWYAWSDGMHPSQRVNGLVTSSNQPKAPIYDAFFSLC